MHNAPPTETWGFSHQMKSFLLELFFFLLGEGSVGSSLSFHPKHAAASFPVNYGKSTRGRACCHGQEKAAAVRCPGCMSPLQPAGWGAGAFLPREPTSGLQAAFSSGWWGAGVTGKIAQMAAPPDSSLFSPLLRGKVFGRCVPGFHVLSGDFVFMVTV